MVQMLWKTAFLKKKPTNLKIESPCDPAIPSLGKQPKELEAESQRDMCTPVFITALFAVATRGSNLRIHGQLNG